MCARRQGTRKSFIGNHLRVNVYLRPHSALFPNSEREQADVVETARETSGALPLRIEGVRAVALRVDAQDEADDDCFHLNLFRSI